MAARVTSGAVEPTREAMHAALAAENLPLARWWSNGPGDDYAWHSHDYHKVLYCQAGSITFHTDDGDVELQAGDRLDLPPGTRHAATVGPGGVTCVEASR